MKYSINYCRKMRIRKSDLPENEEKDFLILIFLPP